MKRQVDLGDRTVTIVGTAHVSRESRKEVRETIESENPDRVCVELDESRYQSLKSESGWSDMNLVETIREGQGFTLFLTLILSIYQRRLGLQQDAKPGEELLEAVKTAEENNIEFALVDRDINKTFNRALDQLSLWEKLKLASSFFLVEEEMDVEDLKQEDILSTLVRELEEEFPSIKRTFLDERNEFMAEKILNEDFDHAIAVVGAAHVEGLEEELKEKRWQNEDDQSSEKDKGLSIPWFRALKYGMPAFILVSLSYVFVFCSVAEGILLARNAFLINALLPFIGAILARSSPLTWIASFVSAPFTSMDPALGAGMVAAYVEGKLKPPTVQEMEDIVEITEYRDLWSNQAGRILLSFVFVTLGSAAATFIAVFYLGTNLAC
ncbi:MAG: TraB/GumN family protein [Candidatus Nanosalina sp.]